MGGEKGMAAAGEASVARANAALRGGGGPAKNLKGAQMLFNKETLEAQAANDREAEANATMQKALSGLGTAGPIERLAQYAQNAQGAMTAKEAAAALFGAIDIKDIANRAPDGPLAQMLGLLEEGRALDPRKSEAELRKFNENAAIVDAVIAGGDAGIAMGEKLEKEGYKNKGVINLLKSGQGTGKRFGDLSRTETKRRLKLRQAELAEEAGDELTDDEIRLLDAKDAKGIKGKGAAIDAKGKDAVAAAEAGQMARGTRDAVVADKGADDGQDRTVAITLTGGNLILHDDGTADIHDGKGIMSQILNAIGLS